MISEKITALESAISASADNRQKADAMNSLAFEIRNTDTHRAISLCREAQKISIMENYAEGNATALANEGFCYVQVTDYELALEKSFEALKIFEEINHEKGSALSHYNLCLVYIRFGDYNNALNHITKSLAVHRENNDRSEIARCLMQLGFINLMINDGESAIEYYNEGLELSRELNNKAGEAAHIMGMGQAYLQRKEYEKSRDYLLQSMQVREQIGDKRGYAATMNTYMTLCYEIGAFEKAKEIALKGFELTEQLDDKMGNTRFRCDLGKIYIKQNKPAEAEKILLEALQAAEKINLKMAISQVSFFLAEIYKTRGDYKRALDYYQRFHRVKEEMLGMEAAMKAKSLQFASRIENARKEAEINRLKNVELKNAYDEIAEKNKDITDSINYALRIQQAILPGTDEIKKSFPDSFVLFKPRDIVSGDFYWFHRAGNDIFLAAADCTGHGVPGAFMSMIGTSQLNEIVAEKEIHNPGMILDELRKGIIKSLKQGSEASGMQDGMDISLLRIDQLAKTLHFAGANNPAFIISAGRLDEIPADKMPIGTFVDINRPFTTRAVQLKKGDALYLFSDGFADQFGGPKSKKFSWKRLESLLCGIQHENMENQKTILESNLDQWKNENSQTDDILVIGMRF